MKQIRFPTFLENLFRDLRDRRLLLPAVGLVIGLLAVPILLKNDSSTETAPATGVRGSGADAAQIVPAVVREQLGVTNYRKRLNQLQSKNPFHKLYTDTPTPSTGAELQSTSTDNSTSTSTSSSSTSAATSDTSAPSTASGSSPSASSSPATPSSTSPSHSTKPTFHLYTYRVAVKVGEANDLKERSEVSALALLPSKHKPILSFLEANQDKALFLVSTDVDSVSGGGRCVPRPKDCQYIVMRPGDKAHFDYAPDGKRYNLVLVDIHAVEIGHKPPTGSTKKSGSAKAADLKQKLPLLGQG